MTTYCDNHKSQPFTTENYLIKLLICTASRNNDSQPWFQIRIRAIKIVNLNNEEVLKQVWPIELEDYRRVIFKRLSGKSN